jgi:hypothetical protein
MGTFSEHSICVAPFNWDEFDSQSRRMDGPDARHLGPRGRMVERGYRPFSVISCRIVKWPELAEERTRCAGGAREMMP